MKLTPGYKSYLPFVAILGAALAIVFGFFVEPLKAQIPTASKGVQERFANMLLDQPGGGAAVPGKPIVVEQEQEPFEERLKRMITLDVREMNIIDVIKFLAFKGDFNIVVSGKIEGRVTLYLKNVSIKDALDIILISNTLAYYVDNNIAHIMPGAEYEAMFGKKFNDKLEVAIINLKYAKPSYVLSALDNIKSALGRAIIDEDTGSVVMIDTPQTLVAMKAAIEKMEKPAEIFVFTLQYAKAETVAEKLRARIDGATVGSITMDERSNQIIIRALPERRKEVEEMLKSLDVPTKEVLIEVNVLQIVMKPTFDVGIDWEIDFSSLNDKILKGITFNNVFLDEDNLTSSGNLLNSFTKIGVGSIAVNHFAAAVRFLKQVNDTKILSNPKILVTNNEEAIIHIGDTVPYIISTTSGTGDNAITSEDVRFVDVGLKLNVKPTINDDGFVTMKLKPEISSVITSIESQGGGIPQVNKTTLETTVMVQDGMTIILGGLKKDNKVHVKKGFPGLMDVPFLEKVFSRTADSIEKTEIVLFITPHIITGKESLNQIDGNIKAPKSYNGEKKTESVLKLKE